MRYPPNNISRNNDFSAPKQKIVTLLSQYKSYKQVVVVRDDDKYFCLISLF